MTSNWPGSSLERPGLKTMLAIPICFARAWSEEPRLSVIINTGGWRFILPSRFTTSKPPWNDEPPEVGMPRSETTRNGMPALPSRPAFFTAASGSSASTTWYPPEVKWSARMRRTSSSSSTRRMTFSAGGLEAGGREGGGGGAAGGGSGAGGDPAAASAGGEAAGIGAVSSSGSTNDDSRAAVESRRSSSMPRARSSSSSWGLIPSGSISSTMSRAPTRVGASSERLKLNCPSRRRMSCCSATSMRWRSIRARCSGDRVRARESSGAVSQVNEDVTNPSRKTIAPSPAPVRIER